MQMLQRKWIERGAVMRLIDADQFKNRIAGASVDSGFSEEKKNEMFDLIDREPTSFDLSALFDRIKDGIECAELYMELNNEYEDCNLKNRNKLIFFETKRCYEEFWEIVNSSIKNEAGNLGRLEVVE